LAEQAGWHVTETGTNVNAIVTHNSVAARVTFFANTGLDPAIYGWRLEAEVLVIAPFSNWSGLKSGSWNDAEIKRAITQGIDRDGHALSFPMGFFWYGRMADRDVNAIVAWLRTLPPLE
jgi:hypothetical protein